MRTKNTIFFCFTIWFAVACSPVQPQTSVLPTESVEQITEVPTTVPSPSVTPVQTELAEADVMPDPIQFLLQGSQNSSILSHPTGKDFLGTWEGLGTVFFFEDQFHMFYNDEHGNWPPRRINIGYATSPDGVTWLRDSQTHVFSADQVSYLDGDQILGRTVLVEADGTWVMFFDTVSSQYFGRATSSGPRGPWTADPEPILIAGDETDPFGIASLSVVKSENSYYMYYASFESALNFEASGGNPHSSIRLATSSDGVHWQKHSEPVLSYPGGNSWDFYKAESPSVVVTPDGWVMLYRADSGTNSWADDTGYGLAISQDGLNWTRIQDNPVVSENELNDIRTLWSVALAYYDETFFIYFSADGFGFRGTQMYVATYQGSLP